MKQNRPQGLSERFRHEIISARNDRRWSQEELGRRAGISQPHVCSIESGKSVPRFDTYLDLIRTLGRDIVIVPRALITTVEALTTAHASEISGQSEKPLYSVENLVGDELEED